MSRECERSTFNIPQRIAGSMPGVQFAASITDVLPGPARELAIFQQLSLGNVPDFMRTSRSVVLVGGARVIEVEVLPDVLCVGTDEDFVRVPLTAPVAQRAADLFGGSLITPLLSDRIWEQADVCIDPMTVTMPPTAEMSSTKWFVDQNAKIEAQRAGRRGLIAGHKKDIVLANTLARPEFKDRCVAIYGWHLASDRPIQGLNPSPGMKNTHAIDYVDYSHGVRLIAEDLLVNGDPVTFLDAVNDPELASMLNGGGVLLYRRYPTG